MKSVTRLGRLAAQATLTLAALGVANHALAAGTASSTIVGNLATVDYTVNAVIQGTIESSPTGNSTPGPGNGGLTSFVVDNMVDLTVAEIDGIPFPVNPGQADAYTAFTVTNTGNTAQDYLLTAANLAIGAVVHGNADGVDGNNLRTFIDANGNGVYDPVTDVDTFIDSLPADTTATVFVVVDTPFGAPNGSFANVSLTAVTYDAGTGAATITNETVGAGGIATVDVVFADAGNDGLEFAEDGYVFSAADLSISKSNTIVSDPINLAVQPKAIPGATVEYAIELTNNGGLDAESVLVTDVIGPDLALLLGQYAGGTDISIEVGVGPASVIFCTAAADLDGCQLTGSTLEVNLGTQEVGTTALNNPVRVLFQATIN